MSVLIKGVAMPKSCQECAMNCLRGFNGSDFLANKRADGCQLVEIKTPHGRLIDVDLVVALLFEEANKHTIIGDMNRQIMGLGEVISMLEKAPTLIEAEGGGEDGN